MSSERATALFQAAQQYFLAGRVAEAEQALTQAVRTDPQHPYSLYLRGMAAGEAGRLDESLGLLDQAVGLGADQPSLSWRQGLRRAEALMVVNWR